MSVNGIQRLQTQTYQAKLENKGHGQDDVERAIDQHKSSVEEAYEQSLVEIEKEKAARQTKSLFTLLGAIFLGPLIGSMIGGAIGDAANDGDEGAAREAKKQSELAGLDVAKAFDRFEDARAELDEHQQQARQVQKFANEMRDAGWTGVH